MSINPYQSPQVNNASITSKPPERQDALKSLRVATVLLTTASLFNIFAFYHTIADFFIIVGTGPTYDSREITMVAVATTLLVVACWFLLLPILEFLAQLIREILATKVDRNAWNDALYRSLKPAAFLAAPGMVLWLTWVFAFYYLRVNFFVISYAVGIPAHILGACLYVPLIVRWYRLYRATPSNPSNDAA
ncbi:hypothetical protein ACYFX5_11075 [Bremerella sp. T1]|uniref:hypothetical protein n=1 Tax=Bremerella sp. TYQ1 TaxID=3119568 RepID=UPI001CCF8FA8|nr:hypothetical protein [Bremerella volcania]UBM38790.1 hypothetical protein LA756_13020 [Bremerella volcania]